MTWRAFGQAFVTLLVILDPLGGVPVFLGLTRSLDPAARDHAAYTSVLAASGVLAVFAGFGQVILQYLSISVESLMVAGGVLLFVVALEMLRGGGSLTTGGEQASVALVLLGTPLLAGPGAIVATIVRSASTLSLRPAWRSWAGSRSRSGGAARAAVRGCVEPSAATQRDRLRDPNHGAAAHRHRRPTGRGRVARWQLHGLG